MAALHKGPQHPKDKESSSASKRDRQLSAMEKWFRSIYEDPAERTPYESAEGGYIWIYGGPFDAKEVLDAQFAGKVSQELIDELAELLTGECGEWTYVNDPLDENEGEEAEFGPDPDETPIKDRRLVTQPYDLVVESLISQITNKTIFLRPISERPSFQRRYVWTNRLASRFIESILLKVPIPPCYLSQNEDFELDVIDGQQRIYSLYRYVNNQFKITDLEILKEFNQYRFHQLPFKTQRQIMTYTLRLIVITNESHPEIKFDVFERLNSNTVPLNAQEIRNCIYRGRFNDMLKDAVEYGPWLEIMNRAKKEPDRRMRDNELVLRFFAYHLYGVEGYRTPQKHWLNDTAKAGMKYDEGRIQQLLNVWSSSIDKSLLIFEPRECFRRSDIDRQQPVNKMIFDLVMYTVSRLSASLISSKRQEIRDKFDELLHDSNFRDLLTRGVDHKKRTGQRFSIWIEKMNLG